jgi:hypothetical protein
VGAELGRPDAETVEWAKALVAAGFTPAVVVELVGLLRSGPDDRAEMAAWALAFGDIPVEMRSTAIDRLLEVMGDRNRREAVRGQAVEAAAEQLEFSEPDDPLRRAAEALMTELVEDPSPVVRFWASFGLGKLKAKSALPVLRLLVDDATPVPRWWTVGEEASDAIDLIEGRRPPNRVPAGPGDQRYP